jgi:hypothetical protein
MSLKSGHVLGAFKALYHDYPREKSRLRLDMDEWIHVLPLRKSRHDGENDGSIAYTWERRPQLW